MRPRGRSHMLAWKKLATRRRTVRCRCTRCTITMAVKERPSTMCTPILLRLVNSATSAAAKVPISATWTIHRACWRRPASPADGASSMAVTSGALCTGLLDRLAADQRRLAAGQHPPAGGGHQRHGDQDGQQVERRYMAQVAQDALPEPAAAEIRGRAQVRRTG